MGTSSVQPYAICGATVFDGENFLPDHCVIVENGCISDVLKTATVPGHIVCQQLEGGILASGFIDIQVNGGGGAMLNNAPDVETVRSICDAHIQFGTTSLLP